MTGGRLKDLRRRPPRRCSPPPRRRVWPLARIQNNTIAHSFRINLCTHLEEKVTHTFTAVFQWCKMGLFSESPCTHHNLIPAIDETQCE